MKLRFNGLKMFSSSSFHMENQVDGQMIDGQMDGWRTDSMERIDKWIERIDGQKGQMDGWRTDSMERIDRWLERIDGWVEKRQYGKG